MTRLLAALTAAVLLPAAAGAQPCPDADASPALSGLAMEDRVAFLRERLGAERTPAVAWSWTFGVVNGALTVGQLLAATTARSGADRGLLLAGAATSGLGLAQIALAPIAPTRQELAPGPDRCAELVRLERALTRGARNERLGSGPAAQAGNLVINAAFGLAAGLVARRALPGVLTFAAGWSLGEVQILTEPARLGSALDQYRAGALRAEGPAGGRRPSPRVTGLSVRMTF